ncbi:hypothetical protein SFRURICE_005349 [Spodoptera frugiperda]|nr:hypothetical protein SFRURICE_005349 [Spodoptera frugiperda]
MTTDDVIRNAYDACDANNAGLWTLKKKLNKGTHPYLTLCESCNSGKALGFQIRFRSYWGLGFRYLTARLARWLGNWLPCNG